MGWKTVKLSQVLKQYRIEHLVQDNTNYKQVSILNDGSVVLRGEKNGKEIGRKRQFVIDLEKHPNTLIFTRQLLLQGSIGIADKTVDKCIVTENMPMFSITDNILVEYLFIYLKSEVFKAQVRNTQTSGTAQKSIHERQFLNYEIPLPSIKEQKEFVTKFKATDNFNILESELQHQSDLIKKLRQSILQDAVQGKLVSQNAKDEPATILLEKIKAEKQKLIAEGKLKKEKELPHINFDEIPFELPKGWIWGRLGEICNKITDGFHNTPPRVKDGFPYILSTHVKSEKIDFENCFYVEEKYHKELWHKAFPQKGEILVVNIGAGCGTPAIIDVDFEFSFKNTAILKQNRNVINKYLFNYILSIQSKISNEITQGGAQPYLSLKMLNNLLFPLPPLSEQERIVAKVEELMQTCDALEKEVEQSKAKVQQLMQSLLREAFEPA